MSLKGLIRNQKIIIDDHRRGVNEIKNWDDKSADIHIDKSTDYPIDGEKQNVRIKIPINSNKPIAIKQKRAVVGDIPNRLQKEIKIAFQDKKIRQAFIRDLLKVLKNFDSTLENELKAKKALEQISKHFDLKWPINSIPTYIEEALTEYKQIYSKGKDAKKYYAKINSDSIELGTDYSK